MSEGTAHDRFSMRASIVGRDVIIIVSKTSSGIRYGPCPARRYVLQVYEIRSGIRWISGP